MSIFPQHNLDYLAAKHAQAIITSAQKSGDQIKPKDLENVITNALGVLQENGVYACFLYLLANKKKDKQRREGKEVKKDDAVFVIQAMLGLLGEDKLGLPRPPEKDAQGDDVLKYIAEKITADLPTLLVAKEALEQMLIYARYGAKAADKGEKNPGGSA